MTNAELIKALRYCKADSRCGMCEWYKYCESRKRNNESCLEQLHDDAAAALEAADKRIAELEADKKTLINVVKDKSEFHATKDAMRIADLEARLPKEGYWIPNSPFTGNCSECGGDGNLKDNYCSNCGARMTKGEDDEH